MNSSGCEAKSGEYLYLTCSFPISEYAKKVERELHSVIWRSLGNKNPSHVNREKDL